MAQDGKFNNSYNLKSILSLTKSVYDHLTRSEQKVANVVLENPGQIIYSSVSDLAEIAGVGDTTVLRYCRKIGYKGYYAFKLALAQELSVKTEETSVGSRVVGENDSMEETIRKTINSNLLAIEETAKLIIQKQVEKAVEAILNARKIFFFGSGISNITAVDAMYKFLRIGFDVNAFTEMHYQSMAASLLNSEDLAVAFTFSGSTKDTIEIMKVAKKAGAKTICVTHYLKSPITNFSDFVLLMGSKEGPFEGGAIETKINQLLVVDILYHCVYNRISQKAREAKEKISLSIMDKLY